MGPGCPAGRPVVMGPASRPCPGRNQGGEQDSRPCPPGRPARHRHRYQNLGPRQGDAMPSIPSSREARPAVAAATQPDPAARRRWLALAVLAVAQFMVFLDETVVNVALPSIKTSLGFSEPSLAWVINAYVLVFGGLILLGARALQGLGAALATPAALALVTGLFPAGAQRTKALTMWGALSGLGFAAGVLLGGVITQAASWRWVFFINVPIALAGLLVVPRLVTESR